MFRDTVLCCIAIGLIQLTSGEQCAYDVRLIQNQTGCFVEWSELGKTCGPVWIRTGTKNYYNDTLLTATPMSIVCGSNPRVICSQRCTNGYNINIINATSTVSTTRPTTSKRLMTTPLRSVPISNTVTQAPRGPIDEITKRSSSPAIQDSSTVSTTRPTTSNRLVTKSPRSVPISHIVTPAPRATRVPKEPEDEFPTLLVVLSVCSVIVLILVVLLVVCLVKKRRTQPDKKSASDVNSARSLRREDIRHIDTTDGPDNDVGTYAEIGEVSHPARGVCAVDVENRPGTSATVGDVHTVGQRPPKVSTGEPGRAEGTYNEIGEVSPPARDVHAVAVKKQDRAGTSAVGDMYAVVQKPPKEYVNSADTGSLYAEVQKKPPNDP